MLRLEKRSVMAPTLVLVAGAIANNITCPKDRAG
jgi:hypothetical protein